MGQVKADSSLHSLGSHFFFPNSIGLSTPLHSSRTTLRNGFALNAGIEYRPKLLNSFFYRVDLDLLSNNYTNHQYNLPTNIIQGKLGSDFILAGAGYRRKLSHWALYAEALPGLGMRSFDKVTSATDGFDISRETDDSFSAKFALGAEYYIKQHFDLFFEPSYYKYFSHAGFNSSRSQLLGFNIGVATARF